MMDNDLLKRKVRQNWEGEAAQFSNFSSGSFYYHLMWACPSYTPYTQKQPFYVMRKVSNKPIVLL